jgi:predicted ATP-dependent endonuclease of OLD family
MSEGARMKLKKVLVKHFKCIKDSTEFTADERVTCLVGKNESGKTAILQAMEKLNPVDPADAKFDILDYPRAEMSEYQESGEEHDAIITTWELTDQDVSAVQAVVGPDVLRSNELVIKKGYYNSSIWDVKLDETKAFHNLLDSANLHEEERKALVAAGSLKAAHELLKTRPAQEGQVPRSPREQTLFERMEKIGGKMTFWQTVVNELQKRLPKMVYFSEYLRMPGQVSLNDLETRAEAKNEKGNKVFMALLGMIGRDTGDLKKIGEFERLQADLEAASNRLTREIFTYWTQNKNLKVQFRFDAALPQDPPPFNNGYIMRTRIENLRHGVSTSFDERSSGFVWFFSFLVWFNQVKKNYGDNLILLLDEPGLALHAKAQADLLRYIEERLAPKYQVFYTTHSPFMIDPADLLRVRTVEDIFIPANDGKPDQDLGTKVGDQVLSTDRDTLFPLQAALGYEITQTLFIGEHSLLVEGPAEILYLPWFSRKLESKGKKGLDKRWTLTPCGGIDKIPAFLVAIRRPEAPYCHIARLCYGTKGQG